MRYFYWSLLRQIPKALFNAEGITSAIVALFFAGLALLNRQVAGVTRRVWRPTSNTSST
jgi:hypothetical protein